MGFTWNFGCIQAWDRLHKLDFNRCKTLAMLSNSMEKLRVFSTYSLLCVAYEPKFHFTSNKTQRKIEFFFFFFKTFSNLHNCCEDLCLSIEHRTHTKTLYIPEAHTTKWIHLRWFALLVIYKWYRLKFDSIHWQMQNTKHLHAAVEFHLA